MKINLTIAIPAYNSAKTIRDAIESALMQDYPSKEVVVFDDASTDDTVKIASEYPEVRLVVNPENMGIGLNLANCMEQAKGRYILYLCADDIFTDKHVASDVTQIFNHNGTIGVINRYYYQFMDGHPGAVMTVRDKRLLTACINPSGMAFRCMKVYGINRIFLEMPFIVHQYLKMFQWTTMEWDTVAVRLHEKGNTGCKSSYYTESPIQVLTEFLGKDFKYHLGLIQLKNRAPKLLWREICLTVKLNRRNLSDPFFWVCALTSLLTPRMVLIALSNFYRHRINRNFCKIIKKPGGEIVYK